MLKVIFSELIKLRRQRLIRLVSVISIIMPLAWTIKCIKDQLPYTSLVGLNILVGCFLIAPCIFCFILLMLFQMDDQNNTKKDIFVTGITKRRVYLSKFFVAVIFMFLYVFFTFVFSIIGGWRLESSGYVGKTLLAFGVTAIASLGACMPITLIIVMLHKKYLLSMIVTNTLIIIDFILLWQLTMFQLLNLDIPILIAYRITYPIQIVEYTAIFERGLKTLYYPTFKGIIILLITTVISLTISEFIYSKQGI